MIDLSGIRLKRTRAWKQLNCLNADIDTFLDSRPYRPAVKFKPQRQKLTVQVEVHTAIDPMWSIRIGEIIHNFRSALDHIVWELAGRPSIPGTKTQFPVFHSQDGFDARGRKNFLKQVDSSAVKLIESEQPFFTRKDGTAEGADASPLWHLKELSDIDKHRTIHLTVGTLAAYSCNFPKVAKAFTLIDVEQHPGGPVQEGTILWSGVLHGATEWPFEKGDIKAEFGVEVAFEDGTPAPGMWGVKGTLNQIGNRTDHILRRIAEEILHTEL